VTEDLITLKEVPRDVIVEQYSLRRKTFKLEEKLPIQLTCPIEYIRIPFLKSPLSIDPFNYDHQHFLACLIETIKQGGSSMITEWINQLVIIAKNIIARAQINKLFMVVKSDQGKYSRHEYLVGLVLNNLRKEIPNFMFTYNHFVCQDMIKTGKEVILWCDEGQTKTSDYLILEYVPGPTWSDKIKTVEPAECLNILLQVFLALQLAYTRYNFTHYDLHDRNIIITPLANTKIIKYRDIDLPVNSIATIIDYGYSYLEYRCQKYGYFSVSPTNDLIYGDRSFPLYDVYKLIMFTFYKIRNSAKHKKELLPLMEQIFSYFSDLDPYPILDRRKKSRYYFSIPYTSRTKQFRLDSLIDYLLTLRSGLRSGSHFSSRYPVLSINRGKVNQLFNKRFDNWLIILAYNLANGEPKTKLRNLILGNERQIKLTVGRRMGILIRKMVTMKESSSVLIYSGKILSMINRIEFYSEQIENLFPGTTLTYLTPAVLKKIESTIQFVSNNRIENNHYLETIENRLTITLQSLILLRYLKSVNQENHK